MENNNDWKEKTRELLLNGTLEYIYPALDVRDLELRGYYAVACLGHIMAAKQEKLLEHLHNYKGNFKDIKHVTIEKVRQFLKPRIK